MPYALRLHVFEAAGLLDARGLFAGLVVERGHGHGEGEQVLVLEDRLVLLALTVGIDRLVAIPHVDIGPAGAAVFDHLEDLVIDVMGWQRRITLEAIADLEPLGLGFVLRALGILPAGAHC